MEARGSWFCPRCLSERLKGTHLDWRCNTVQPAWVALKTQIPAEVPPGAVIPPHCSDRRAENQRHVSHLAPELDLLCKLRERFYLSIYFFFFLLSVKVLGKKKKSTKKNYEKNLERFMAEGTDYVSEGGLRLTKPLFVQSGLFSGLYYCLFIGLHFLHQAPRGRSPKSFPCAQKGLLLFHLQMFIVY